MRKAIVAVVLIVVATPVLAQQSLAEAAAQAKASKSALAPDAPSREDVLKLFDMLQLSKTMDAVLKGAKQQSKEVAEQMIQEKVPEATPEQKKQFEEMMDDVFTEAMGPKVMNEILEATVPVYQRHLTKSDLQAMIAFYSSPVGQKLLREQPAMVQESMQAAAAIQQRVARSIFLKIDERMEKMINTEKDHAKQP
jgi:uncharacterized protein